MLVALNENDYHYKNETYSARRASPGAPPRNPLIARVSEVALIVEVEMILILVQGVLARCVLL